MKHLWEALATDLGDILKRSGEAWFRACEQSTPSHLFHPGANPRFMGAAEESIGVIQYQSVAAYIQQHRLMTRSDLNAFARFFTSRFFIYPHTAANRTLEYLQYDTPTRLCMFARDISEHLTGRAYQDEAMLIYARAGYDLLEAAQHDTARVFARYNIKPPSLWRRLWG